MTPQEQNYWDLPDAALAAAWREVESENYADDVTGEKVERFNFVEDAILQRIGAPETVSSDDGEWLARIREFAGSR